MEQGHWRARAACRSQPTWVFFPRLGEDPRLAKSVCARCPVRVECLEAAVGEPELQGVWGGTTLDERRAIRRRRKVA